jgi:hypothetical protein
VLGAGRDRGVQGREILVDRAHSHGSFSDGTLISCCASAGTLASTFRARWIRHFCRSDRVVSVDSTSVRAHHHAAGARKAPPLDVSAERLAVAFVDDQLEVAGSAQGLTGGRVELRESAG